MMVPILDEIIHDAAEGGVQHVMIAMAHRGRLNVLAHILQKPYPQILAEFKDPILANRLRVDLGWMGDVKYHAGARIEAQPDGLPKQVIISMPPNPSHLEAVDPVLNGMARAAATSADQPGPPIVDKGKVLAILIHGDAAFPGQGIVAETLNLSRLDGYDVGGIIHIIANNQLGFTTDPEDSFSTSYASGLARGFKIPITHVNADDPVACIEAARLAIAYRQRFKLDYLIDLVGYRRYGHNEGDEPAFTQPQIYQIVAAHPTRARAVREGADRVAARSPQEQADALVQARMEELERAYAVGQARAGLHPAGPGSAAERRRQESAHRGAARHAAGDQQRADDGARGLHGPSQARARPRAPQGDVRVAGRAIDRLGRRRGAGAWRRSSPTACRSGSPAKTSSAAPSAIATASITMRSPAKSTSRCRRCRRRRRRSRFATARCPNTPASASSSATTCRSRHGW